MEKRNYSSAHGCDFTRTMRIYYAHSRQIYGTERERKERDFISDMFRNCEIVCPNRDMGELGSIDPYLDMVESSDVVVCTELDDMIGTGVFSEVKRARKLGKPVLIMRGYRFYPVTGQMVVDRLNKIRYGRLISLKRKARRMTSDPVFGENINA